MLLSANVSTIGLGTATPSIHKVLLKSSKNNYSNYFSVWIFQCFAELPYLNRSYSFLVRFRRKILIIGGARLSALHQAKRLNQFKRLDRFERLNV